jgi:hypothetical protein
MNNLILFSLLLLSTSLFADDLTCPVNAPTPAVEDLLNTLKKSSECLYKDIATLKVNMDGEGKLSVFYEKGVPKLLKLTYTNKSGTTIKQITFDDLAKGKQLIYENPSKKGKAIVFEKADSFKQDKKYKFNLNVRSSVDPEKHATYPLEFDSDESNPKVSSSGNLFGKMVLSPGISFLSWDGTFKKVEFQK